MSALAKASADAGATRMPKKPLLLRQSSSVERAGQSLERSVRAYLDSLEEKSETAIRFLRPELEIGLQRVHLTLQIEASLLHEAAKNRVEEGAIVEKKEDPGADTKLGRWINLPVYIDFREVPMVLRSEDPRLSAFADASLQHSFQGNVLQKSAVKLLQFALHYFTGDSSYLSTPKNAWAALDGFRDGDSDVNGNGYLKRPGCELIERFDGATADDDEDDYTMVNEDDIYDAYGAVSDMISYKSTETDSGASKPRLQNQRSYTPMDVEGLMGAQSKMIDRVAEALQTDRSTAGLMLMYTGWQEAVTLRRYRLENLLFAQACGVTPKEECDVGGLESESESDSDLEEGMEECSYCYEDRPEETMYSLRCGHRFCSICWTKYCSMVVKMGCPNGESCLRARCPKDKCNLLVGEATFKKFLPEDVRHIYDKKLSLSFVDDNDGVTWCPKPGCGNAICYSRRKRTVTCSCGHRFCFTCKKEGHAPATCAEVRKWENAVEVHKKKNEGKPLPDIANMKDKPCPNPSCGAPSFKVDGCLYVTCQRCGCNWCWECGHYGGGKTGRKQPHHVFKCSDPKNEDWFASFAMAFGDDYRFMSFHSSWSRKGKVRDLLKTLAARVEKSLVITKRAVKAAAEKDMDESKDKDKEEPVPTRCALAGTWEVGVVKRSGTLPWMDCTTVEGVSLHAMVSPRGFLGPRHITTQYQNHFSPGAKLYAHVHWDGHVSLIISPKDAGTVPYLLHEARAHKIIKPKDQPSKILFEMPYGTLNPFNRSLLRKPSTLKTLTQFAYHADAEAGEDDKALEKIGCKLEWKPGLKNYERYKWREPTKVYWTRIGAPPQRYQGPEKTFFNAVGNSNIYKLEIIHDALELAAQCNDTLRNTKMKTYYLEKSTLRKKLLAFHESRVDKYLRKLYSFLALNTGLKELNGEDQMILTLVDGNENATKIFESYCTNFESRTAPKDGKMPEPFRVEFNGGQIEPPGDQEQLLQLMRTSSGPTADGKEGASSAVDKADASAAKTGTPAAAAAASGEDAGGVDDQRKKAIAYGKALQYVAGSKGASSGKRRLWDKLTFLLSAVGQCCDQLQHHEFPQVVEEGEADEKLAEMHKEQAAIMKRIEQRAKERAEKAQREKGKGIDAAGLDEETDIKPEEGDNLFGVEFHDPEEMVPIARIRRLNQDRLAFRNMQRPAGIF